MDRNRFIQCMKSGIELSDKERRRIIRKSVEVYDRYGRVCGAYAGNQ